MPENIILVVGVELLVAWRLLNHEVIEAALSNLVGFYADGKKEMFVGSVVVQTFDGIEMFLRKILA